MENQNQNSDRHSYKILIELLIGIEHANQVKEVNCGFSELTLTNYDFLKKKEVEIISGHKFCSNFVTGGPSQNEGNIARHVKGALRHSQLSIGRQFSQFQNFVEVDMRVLGNRLKTSHGVLDLGVLSDSLPNVKILKRAHLKFYYQGLLTLRFIDQTLQELNEDPSTFFLSIDLSVFYKNNKVLISR